VKRRAPIPRDPNSIAAWQQRSRERARASAERRNVPIRGGFGKRGNGLTRKPAPHIAAGFSVAAKGESCCRRCGDTRNLHPHHIVPRSLSRIGRDDLRNCMVLCANCHHAHHGGQPIPRELLSAAELALVEEIAPSIGWLARRYPRTRQEAA